MKKKKFSISAGIIESASECPNHRSCLSGTRTMCKIKNREDMMVMFVKSHGHQSCPFAIPLGVDCICTCPVRVEIFRKYRV